MPIIERVQLAVSCDFSDLGRLRARLDNFPGAQIVDQQFTASGVVLSLTAAKEQLSALQTVAADATQGRVKWS